MKEVWKDINGFKIYYEISNLGRVRSKERTYNINKNGKIITRTNKSKIRKPYPNNKGYLRLDLRVNNKITKFSVHRLVALTFILNTENKPMVNHKDGNKQNNNSRNLEWATHIENETHAVQNNLKRNKNIIQYDMKGNMIDEFVSMKLGFEITGVNMSDISQCCNNKRKSAGGFFWKFKVNKNMKEAKTNR